MVKNSLEKFIEGAKDAWGPLNSETVAKCRRLLEELAMAPVTEKWLADLLFEPTVHQELYRDTDHGFLLLAHSENNGLYRVPHDHGGGWVIYGVQSGEMEMGTYKQTINQKGKTHLIRRDLYRMHPGDCRLYLPGDIHDTRCISSSVLMLRFTSCDLKKEDTEGRMVRYLE